MMERRFPRRISAIDDIHDFVERTVAALDLEPTNAHWVEFVVQELFTNMVKYSREGTKDIAVGIGRRDDRVVIRITDAGVEAFDPTKAPEVDLEHWVTQDRVGGLGIHLVKQIADTITYEYEDRTSVVTVTRRVESRSAAS